MHSGVNHFSFSLIFSFLIYAPYSMELSVVRSGREEILETGDLWTVVAILLLE